MTSGIRKFSIADTRNWSQMEDKQVFGGDVIDKSCGYRMSAMYWRLGKGERADVPAPYDEVWIIIKGALSIQGDGEAVAARSGAVLLVPEATPGVAQIEADSKLLTIAYPPSWEIGAEAWEAVQSAAQEGVRVRKLAVEPLDSAMADRQALMTPPADGSRSFKMDVLFARFYEDAGLALDDEAADRVVAVASGALTVRIGEDSVTLEAGDFAYLPAGYTGVLNATGEAEAVLIFGPANT